MGVFIWRGRVSEEYFYRRCANCGKSFYTDVWCDYKCDNCYQEENEEESEDEE